MRHCDNLGRNTHPEFVFHLLQNLQACLAQPLKIVRRRARFVRPAPDYPDPGGHGVASGFPHLLAALDRTGPRNHEEGARADRFRPHLHL